MANGNINCQDVSTGTTLSKWAIHSSNKARCIALASNGTFIAASANSSISFWDTTTHERIGSAIEHTRDAASMATYFKWLDISTNYDLVVGGPLQITLSGLCDILPSRYSDMYVVKKNHVTALSDHNPLVDRQIRHTKVERADLGKTRESLQIEEDDASTFICTLITAF